MGGAVQQYIAWRETGHWNISSVLPTILRFFEQFPRRRNIFGHAPHFLHSDERTIAAYREMNTDHATKSLAFAAYISSASKFNFSIHYVCSRPCVKRFHKVVPGAQSSKCVMSKSVSKPLHVSHTLFRKTMPIHTVNGQSREVGFQITVGIPTPRCRPYIVQSETEETMWADCGCLPLSSLARHEKRAVLLSGS